MEKIRNNTVPPMAKDPSKRQARTKHKRKKSYLAGTITSVFGRNSGEKKVLSLNEKLNPNTSTKVENKKNPVDRTRNNSYALDSPANQSWSKFRKKMRAKGFDF